MIVDEEKLTTFCHDQLKHGFTKDLVRVVRALEGQSDDFDFVKKFGQEIMTIWFELNAHTKILVEKAEVELSPVNFFQQYPLNRLESKDNEWMSGIIFQNWLKVSDIRNLSMKILKTLEDITIHCKLFETMVSDTTFNKYPGQQRNFKKDYTGSQHNSLTKHAVELHSKCRALISEINYLIEKSDLFSVSPKNNLLK